MLLPYLRLVNERRQSVDLIYNQSQKSHQGFSQMTHSTV